MQEINVSLDNVHTQYLQDQLDAALPHLKGLGLSIYGDNRPISIWVPDHVTGEDRQKILEIAQAHDPSTLPDQYLIAELSDADRQRLVLVTMLDQINVVRAYIGLSAISAEEFDTAVMYRIISEVKEITRG